MSFFLYSDNIDRNVFGWYLFYLINLDFFQEEIAIAKLRKSILAATGNIHFYKSGDHYVVFKRQKTS